MNQSFFQKNKVFLVGLLQFVLTTIYELTSGDQGNFTGYIIGYSALVAALTYFGNNLRGQWASISTSVLSSVMVFGGLHDSNTELNFQLVATKIILPLTINIVGVFFTSPPKDRGYEKTATIQNAKEEGKAITAINKTVTP